MSAYSGRLSQRYHHNHTYPTTNKMVRTEKRLENKINLAKQDLLHKSANSNKPAKLTQTVSLTPIQAIGTQQLGTFILYNTWHEKEYPVWLNQIRDAMDGLASPIVLSPQILMCVMLLTTRQTHTPYYGLDCQTSNSTL